MTDILVDPAEFISTFEHEQVTHHSGVPCSLLSPLHNSILLSKTLNYVIATSEGEATAYAAGVWLAGGKSAVWLQNSGLGNLINPLTSLLQSYQIPVLIVCSRRGQPGIHDETQHRLMGKITPDLFKLCEADVSYLSDIKYNIKDHLSTLLANMYEHRKPNALIINKGELKKIEYSENAQFEKRKPNGQYTDNRCYPEVRPSRHEALEVVNDCAGDSVPIITTTGYTSRELMSFSDLPNHFYMTGSMGYASSIGLGVARNTPQKVMVIDGDGAVLMNMGTLATIGKYQPKNLIHIIVNNAQYHSTGGQPTTADTIDFGKLASECGYKHALSVDTINDFSSALQALMSLEGPSCLHIQTNERKIEGLPRPDKPHSVIAERFRTFMCS